MEICVDSSYHKKEINARIKLKQHQIPIGCSKYRHRIPKTSIVATCWRLFFFRDSSTGIKRVANRYSKSLQNKMLIDSSKKDIATKVADIVEKATRAENDVSGHKQRYHTKDGVIWKDKAPYHRGGKDS